MKFKSIKLTNFMRYKGENRIEFSCDPDNNVTIILGDNTFGKTTIAQAFRWGLYESLNTTNYDTNKKDIVLLNSEVLATSTMSSTPMVSVEIVVVDNETTYKFTRTAKFRRKSERDLSVFQLGKTELTMQIIEDGIPGEIINNDGSSKKKGNNYSENCVQDIINNMLPESLSNYFLFDGEKWNDLKKKTDEIKTSIHTILGISELQAMQKHIGSGANSVINMLHGMIKGSTDEIKKLNAEILSLEQSIENNKKQMEICAANIDTATEDKTKLKEILDSQKGNDELKKEVAEHERRIDTYTRYRDQFYRDIVKGFSGSAEYFAASMLPEVNLLLESVDLEGKDIPGVTVDTVEYLLKHGECLCGEPLIEGTKGYTTLVKLKKVIPPEMLGGAAKRFQSTLERWARYAEQLPQNLAEKAESFESAQDDLDDEIDARDRKQAKIDKKSNTEVVRRQYNAAIKALDENTAKMNRLSAANDYSAEQIAKKRENLELLASQGKENEKINRAIEYAKAILETAKRRVTIRENGLLSELNEIIKENHAKMFNEKEKIAKLEDDFKIHVYYKDLNGFMKEEKVLSGGEGVAINFVFIVSILELAKKWKSEEQEEKENTMDLPLVLDAPFSSLSQINAKLIGTRLPMFAEQVIIFMLDKDWVESGLDRYTKSGYCYRVNKAATANSSTLEKIEGGFGDAY